MLIMVYDLRRLLYATFPWGLAAFCHDTTESWNHVLKTFYLGQTKCRGGVGDKGVQALVQNFMFAFMHMHAPLL